MTKSRLRSTPMRAGFFGLGLWFGALTWAFMEHPHLDNLAVGYPVWVAGGLPALERLAESPALFALVALIETWLVFAVFAGVGFAIQWLRRSTREPGQQQIHSNDGRT